MVHSKEEKATVGERGLVIYEGEIAPRLSDNDQGRYVAIDVNTGEWEIDDTRDATKILRARLPDAEIFTLWHINLNQAFFGAPRGLSRRLGLPDGLSDSLE